MTSRDDAENELYSKWLMDADLKRGRIQRELENLEGRTDANAVERSERLRSALGRLTSKSKQVEQVLVDKASLRAAIDEGTVRMEGGSDDGGGSVRATDSLAGSFRRDVDVATVARDQSFADHSVVRSEVAAEEKRYGDLHFGKYLRGLATGEWHGAEAEQRAMSEGVLAQGGFTVPTLLSSRLIDLARNESVVFRAGAATVPMSTWEIKIARMIGDPTAAFRQENAAITPSDATFDQVTLKARTLAALTVCSRELLEDSVNGEDALRRAFAQQAALTIDSAALYGTGSDPQPRGVKNQTGVTVESMGTNGLALANYDRVIDTIYALPDNNERPNALIYAPRTARSLAKLKDTTNQPLQVPRDVANLTHLVSKQVPINLTQGTSNISSDLFVGDWSQLLIGLRTRFQVQVLTERYAELGQVGFLSWWRGDVAVARPKAFAVLNGIIP